VADNVTALCAYNKKNIFRLWRGC